MEQIIGGCYGVLRGDKFRHVLSVTGCYCTFNNLILLINSKYKVMKTGVTPRNTSMVIARIAPKRRPNAYNPALGAVRMGDRCGNKSALQQVIIHCVN